MYVIHVCKLYVCMRCTYVWDICTHVRTYVCMFACIYICMYVCKAYVHTACPLVLSFHPPAPPSILVPSVRPSVRLSIYPSIFPLIHPPTHPQIHLLLRPPAYLLIQLPTYLPFPWKSDILLPWNPTYYCSWRSLFCHSLHSNSRRLYTLSNNSRLLFYTQRFFIALLCCVHSRYPSRPS